MNIIDFLRKVGILRIGGGTYKGNVGGEFATIDMDRGGSPPREDNPTAPEAARGGEGQGTGIR